MTFFCCEPTRPDQTKGSFYFSANSLATARDMPMISFSGTISCFHRYIFGITQGALDFFLLFFGQIFMAFHFVEYVAGPEGAFLSA